MWALSTLSAQVIQPWCVSTDGIRCIEYVMLIILLQPAVVCPAGAEACRTGARQTLQKDPYMPPTTSTVQIALQLVLHPVWQSPGDCRPCMCKRYI